MRVWKVGSHVTLLLSLMKNHRNVMLSNNSSLLFLQILFGEVSGNKRKGQRSKGKTELPEYVYSLDI